MASTKTILVVDDDRELREVLELMLGEAGYRVHCAANGTRGIEMALELRPDMIICDMMMPEKSGFMVVETVRNQANFHPRIMMITVNQGQHHRNYAEHLGVDEYVVKPFEIKALLASVRKLCPLE